jgi:hypothetical protein
MDEFTASVIATINARGRVTVGLDKPTDDLRHTVKDSLALGTVADQADEMYHAERTIGAVPDDIDLAGSLTNALGQTITFVEIVSVLIEHSSGAGTITVGNAAANAAVLWFGAAAHTEKVEAGGFVFRHSPADGKWVVTAGTGDILRVNGTDGDKYKIIIIGRTA